MCSLKVLYAVPMLEAQYNKITQVYTFLYYFKEHDLRGLATVIVPCKLFEIKTTTNF